METKSSTSSSPNLSLFKLSYHDETADKKGTHVKHGMQTPIGGDSVCVAYVYRQFISSKNVTSDCTGMK